MTEMVRGWLLSILAVSVLCALADALMPKGAVKQVGRLMCGLVLAVVVVSPVVRLDLEDSGQWLEGYFSGMDQREQDLKEQVDSEMKTIIEQEYEAYIVDKAAQLGLDCTARVECRMEESVYLPAQAWIEGALTREEREKLTAVLSEDLGLSSENQSYTDGEEML